MQAVVYRGPHKVSVEEVENPRIMSATDAIVEVTSAAICGSDLHMYDGRTQVETGKIFGHEIMGIVREVGDSVTEIHVGDRVVLPFNIACGTCFNCTRGYTNACLVMNPENAGAAYGYAGMGPYQGGQAQQVRVPFAEFNCLKLPGRPGDEFEGDFLLLADIFPTAFHATELANVRVGDSVAIFGAGPVGLLTALSCELKGAADVYVIDEHPDRLELAKRFGATPIDFRQGDPVDQIKDKRKHDKLIQQSLRPGEEKMDGVMCVIDAVGYQAHEVSHPNIERANQVIGDLARLVNPAGHIGTIGVFLPQDPGGANPEAKQGEYLMPWGKIWEKGLSIGTGQCPVKKYNAQLRDLIIAGRVKPSTIVSHKLPIEAAPDAYEHFDHRDSGYTKVVLQPNRELVAG